MDLILLEIPKPDPLPWLERERARRKKAMDDADARLSLETERLKVFQGKHYMMNKGVLVPRISGLDEAVWAAQLEFQRLRLSQELSTAHDNFQKALREWSELQP
jgi:hypothetical protein